MEENSNLKDTGQVNKDKNNRTEKVAKKNSFVLFFENLIAEFRKVVWPSRNELFKQTVVVIIISLFMGALIFGMDALFNFLQSLVAGLTL